MFGKFSSGRSWWLSPWPSGSSLRRLRCEHPFLPTSLLGVALRRFQRLHRCHRQIPLDGHRSGCQLSCYHVMSVMFVYSTHLYTLYTRVERCGKHCLKNISLVDENGPVVSELICSAQKRPLEMSTWNIPPVLQRNIWASSECLELAPQRLWMLLGCPRLIGLEDHDEQWGSLLKVPCVESFRFAWSTWLLDFFLTFGWSTKPCWTVRFDTALLE